MKKKIDIQGIVGKIEGKGEKAVIKKVQRTVSV